MRCFKDEREDKAPGSRCWGIWHNPSTWVKVAPFLLRKAGETPVRASW